MTDTHCHLNDPQFSEDLEEVIERASALKRINVVGYDVTSSFKAVELAERFDRLWAVVGLHPYEAENFKEEDIERIKSFLSHPKVVAIGEIGLDYYRGPDKSAQRALFVRQIELALESSMPVVLHVRDALDDVMSVLSDYPKVKFLFHSFSGDERDVERVMRNENWYVSFSGMLTFLPHVRRAASAADRSRTLVETDAPYLAPVPKRGRRNEPAYVKYTLEELSRVWEIEFEEAERITDENSDSFFSYESKFVT